MTINDVDLRGQGELVTSTDDENKQPYNGFNVARKEIWERLTTPLLHTTIWLNLVVGVVGLGGIAIWIEWWHWAHAKPEEASLGNLKLALATVFPAIMGGSALELCLSKTVITRNIGLFVLAICLLAALYLLAFGNPSDSLSIKLSAGCCLLALVVWWLARGRDETMQDTETPDPIDAVGGAADRSLNKTPTKIKT
ncbi:MAG: hypothetical protein K0M60_01565 [Hydrogenophaga sp.]|nr:hypothetical protein [Hydrogenophaga sp.]